MNDKWIVFNTIEDANLKIQQINNFKQYPKSGINSLTKQENNNAQKTETWAIPKPISGNRYAVPSFFDNEGEKWDSSWNIDIPDNL